MPSSLRIAIVGSGPSAFYAAGYLLDHAPDAEIDMIERLPTPYGLVRGGVAPDHAKIKNVTKVYDKIAENPRFRFLGGVEFGRDLTLDDICAHYHAVLYATGAQTDRRLGIPGEDLPGSYPATAFVGWYNGHPDYADEHFDLTATAAAVIGNGNVAMDVARILSSTPDLLATTDISDEALAALRESRVRTVYIVGRRAAAQAAFTNAEIKELGELPGVTIEIAPEEAALDPLSAEALAAQPDRVAEGNLKVLAAYAARGADATAPRRIVIRFLLSPVEIVGGERVEALRVVRNRLVSGGDGSLRAQATDETETIPVGLVFRSIGYKGVALRDVPFDARSGVIPNRGGRVIDPSAGDLPAIGQYCAGWIKRGPSGVIGTNKPDAIETADLLLADAQAGVLFSPSEPTRAAVDAVLAARGVDVVSYSDWQALDADERAHGEPGGRPRVKYTRIGAMMEVIHAARAKTP
jgi:ferredoxin--NADP+ reductase